MKTIFAKLSISFIFIIVFCMLLLGVCISFIIREYITLQKENEMVVKAKEIAESTKHFFSNGENPQEFIEIINCLDSNLGTEVWAIDENGIIIAADSPHKYCEGSMLSKSQLLEVKQGKLNIYKGRSECFDDPVIRITNPIIYQDKVKGAIIVYAPIKGIDKATEKLILLFGVSFLFVILVAIILCFFITKRIVKPILNLTEASIAVVEGDRNIEIVTETGFKEFNQLAFSFNYMLKILSENEKKMKDFVENVSHELKSPMTSLKGFTEALIDGKAKTQKREKDFLNIMDKEINRLNILIDNLLVLCKSNKNMYTYLQKVNTFKTIKELIILYDSRLREKNICINIEYKSESYIMIDLNSFKQILINLVDNAIKYSVSNSTILITINQNKNNIEIFIEDKGIGIPKEDIAHIWDRFYRVDKVRSRETGGSGLGLAIVKELTEQSGGTITVTSEIGKGTIFKLEFKKIKE